MNNVYLEKVKRVKEQFPKGTKIELIKMEDNCAPAPGTNGIVDFVDDMGQVHMNWENGSTLALIPDVDRFKIQY